MRKKINNNPGKNVAKTAYTYNNDLSEFNNKFEMLTLLFHHQIRAEATTSNSK